MPLFAAAIFTSAFLLFWVQPLFAKMILPLLGGAPSVWATAMMFFQLVLLAGYGYAHLLTHRINSLRGQVMIHGAVVAAGLMFLPFAVPAHVTPPSDGSPIAWLVGLLAVCVGWPFFALSASAPLLQAWFARGRGAADPYFLYAASNAGSLLALLAFPVALEPNLTLAGQGHAWRGGYWILLVLLTAIGAVLLRRDAPAPVPARDIAPAWKQRLIWIALAFVPSSLLLGVTTHITTDVASAPLFWVAPFALYRHTFIIAFARPPGRTVLLKTHAAGIIGVAVTTLLTVVFALAGSVMVTIGLHLFAFFVTALACHSELARRRPAASGLTSFYFCMSIGGALGGVFNALLAPVLFSSDMEYYLALVASCGLRLLMTDTRERLTARDIVFALALGGAVAAVTWHCVDAAPLGMLGRILFLLPCGIALYYFSQRALRFTLGVAAVLGGAVLVQGSVDVLTSQRSFFGINKVRLLDGGARTALVHGTTLHGMEFTAPARWREPLAYYARSGPVGQMFALEHPRARAALIGLGTGALACYRPPHADWTFFEIDGAVARLARDTRYFHYLEQCPGSRILLGDGRLSLKAAPDHSYDLIVIDAFSSDSIPTHLLTREALALYLAKLKPHGVILFNLSNKYLKLGPVVGTVVASVNGFGRRQLFYPSDSQTAQGGASGSEWMVIAANKSDLDFLSHDTRWPLTHGDPGIAPWTDDFSNIFRVIAW
jgi:hypothetical protein